MLQVDQVGGLLGHVGFSASHALGSSKRKALCQHRVSSFCTTVDPQVAWQRPNAALTTLCDPFPNTEEPAHLLTTRRMPP